MEDSLARQELKLVFKSWVKHTSRKLLGWCVLALLLVLPEVLFLLATPLPLKWLTDFLASGETTLPLLGSLPRQTFLYIALATLVAIPTLSSLYGVIAGKLQLALSNMLSRRILKKQINHALETDDEFSRKYTVGELLYTLNSQSTQMVDLVTNDYVTIIKSLLIVLGVASILLATIGPFALLLIVPLLFFGFSYVYFGARIEIDRSDVETQSSSYQKYLHEIIQNKKLIQLFGRRRELARRVVNQLEVKQKADVKLSIVYRLLSGANETVVALSVAFVAGVAVFSSKNIVSAGSVVLLINYMYYFFDPLGDAIEALGSIRSRKIALFENFVLMEQDTDLFKSSPNAVPIIEWLQPIKLSNIRLHAHGTQLFDDLSLEIPAKGVTVLIGASGVGKSTIFDLILRRRVPQLGSITHGATRIEDYDIYNWWQGIAVSAQDLSFLTDTVEEIVSFGEPNRELKLPDIEASIAFSASQNFLHQLTEKHPDATISALEVSEGQRQRIVLARAIYTKRPIMLMDEPISALDEQSKKLVIHNIDLLRNTRTMLIISHDPAILDIADTIYHLKSGGEVVKVTAAEGKALV